MSSQSKTLNTIIRHIRKVEDNCNKLAKAIAEEGDYNFSRKLIQLGRIHDASKFDDFEFEHLGNFETTKSEWFKEALGDHHRKNPHHPEHWSNGIKDMPQEYIAEMVCDCVARGQEFGTDTRKWFTENATKKYGFSMDDEIGKQITKYLNMLLEKPF